MDIPKLLPQLSKRGFKERTILMKLNILIDVPVHTD